MAVYQPILKSVRRVVPCLLVLVGLVATDPALAQPQPEIQVSTKEISDFEFDWGRDGVFCPACNNGDGNARLTFVNRRGWLWVGKVDFNTGNFVPSDGRGERVDGDAAIATDFGNGPEWLFTAAGSQIVYTKYLPGQPHTPENAGLALAAPAGPTPTARTPPGGSWSAGFLPGGEQRRSPLGSLDLADPQARIVYTDLDSTVYWRYVGDPGSETFIPQIVGNAGASRRWVPDLQQMIYTQSTTNPFGGQGFQQVFLYDLATQQAKQLTMDLNTKWGAFIWQAPEYGGEYIIFALVNRNELVVYREMVDFLGRLRWMPVASIPGTPTLPFIWSPEPFVHNGHSYIVMQMSASPDPTDVSAPSHIALVGVDPAHLPLRVLTDESSPPRVRLDPEYFITAQGPFIYYARYTTLTDSTLFYSEGVWRADTGLGPPVVASTAPAGSHSAGSHASPGRVPDANPFQGVYPNPGTHEQVFELLVAPGQPLRELRIYDVQGRLVMERSLRELGPGTHRIEWDGRSDSGQLLASGVYYATVDTRAGLQSKKIVRVK